MATANPKIVLANEYTTVHSKNWAVKPKPPKKGIESRLKGPCKYAGVQYDNPAEMLKGMHQHTDKELEKFRYPDQDSFKNVEKQRQGGMWSQDLVREILKLNPRLIVQDSVNFKGRAAFYVMRHGVLTYTNAHFQHGFMPQFLVMGTDKADLATTFEPGWRTVLMRLVKFGALKQSVVDRVFGFVAYNDERAKHYHAHVSEFRT